MCGLPSFKYEYRAPLQRALLSVLEKLQPGTPPETRAVVVLSQRQNLRHFGRNCCAITSAIDSQGGLRVLSKGPCTPIE